jgi:hypothetical protein
MTPASVRMPRPPTRPTSRAPRRTLTGWRRSGDSGPITRVSERCITAPGVANILEPSIGTERDTAGRTHRTHGWDTADTRAGTGGHDTVSGRDLPAFTHPQWVTATGPSQQGVRAGKAPSALLPSKPLMT